MKILTIIIILLSSLGGFITSAADLFSQWDIGLPKLVITNVDLSAASFRKALEDVGKYLGVRIVVYMTNDIQKSFTFNSKECTVSNVLDQMAATYDSFEWKQDKRTGVIWFLPKSGEATVWLEFPVKVKRPQPGLRMYTDIIYGLSVFTNGKFGTPRRGASFLDVYDYTVDLPAGLLSLERIINICASFDPDITFWLIPRSDYPGYLTISLGGSWNTAQPIRIVPVFRHFWEREVRQPASDMLKSDALFAAFSNPDAYIRSAAEKTMNVLGFMVPYDDILKTPASEEQRMWAANGLLNAIVWDPKLGSYPFALDILRSKTNQQQLLGLHDPALSVLSAFQIARCGKGTELLTKLLDKPIGKGPLAQVKSELFRMARESGAVRNAIKARRPNWGDLVPDEIDQLIIPDDIVFTTP